MAKGKRFVTALAAVAAGGWVLGLLMQPQAQVHEVVPAWRSEEVRPRPSEPRSSRRIGALVYTLGTADEVYNPGLIRVDDEQNLYVLDYADRRIKKFGPAGELLATFGRGAGTEPGRFANPTDFAVTPAGELWVADPDAGRVTVFAADTRVEEILELETTPYRLALRPGGGFFVMSTELGELFEEYGADRRVRRRFGRLLESEAQSSIALDGWIAATAGGRLVFAPIWLDVFAVYDAGQRVALAATVDGAPLPAIVTEEGGWQSVHPRSWAVNRSLSAAGAEIYLYTVRGRGPGRQGVVDVFDAAGAYSQSWLLDEPALMAVVGRDSIFTVHQGQVQRWRRP